MIKPFPGLGGALLLLAGALAAQGLLAWLAMLWWPWRPINPTLLAGLVNLVALVGVALFALQRSRTIPKFGISPSIGAGFWLGLGGVTGGGTIVLGELANRINAWWPLSPELARVFNQLTEGDLVVSLFTVALVAPVTEELLFRGILLPSFEARWREGPALLLSSALFALFHLNIWQAPTAFLAGLFLGWLYLRTRSLLYPMAAHALFNGLPVLMAAGGLRVSGYNTPLVPGTPEFQPVAWLVGGATLLGLGLWMTKRWAPLSPPPVSDTVEA